MRYTYVTYTDMSRDSSREESENREVLRKNYIGLKDIDSYEIMFDQMIKVTRTSDMITHGIAAAIAKDERFIWLPKKKKNRS